MPEPHPVPDLTNPLWFAVTYAAEEGMAADDINAAHDELYRVSSLEEQLEAAQERLAWAARLLRYPDGGDEFSIDCRNWLNNYYAAISEQPGDVGSDAVELRAHGNAGPPASSPASEPKEDACSG